MSTANFLQGTNTPYQPPTPNQPPVPYRRPFPYRPGGPFQPGPYQPVPYQPGPNQPGGYQPQPIPPYRPPQPPAPQPQPQTPEYTDRTLEEREAMSGLNEFERISLRMWGHDVLDDGKNNGSVILKTLLNPQGSGNEAFLKDEGSRATVYNHLFTDMFDDGQINGSSLRQTFEGIYKKVTGHDISRQLDQAQYTSANLNPQEIFKQAPDLKTPQGLQQASKDTGLNVTQFLNLALWGHDAVDQRGYAGRNIDGSVLQSSLSNPKSIDYGFVNSSPTTKQYTQGLIDKDKQQFGRTTGYTLNTDFLKIVEQIYGIQGKIIPQ